jgi:hypothetical protein
MKYLLTLALVVAFTAPAFAEKAKTPLKAKVPVQIECGK